MEVKSIPESVVDFTIVLCDCFEPTEPFFSVSTDNSELADIYPSCIVFPQDQLIFLPS